MNQFLYKYIIKFVRTKRLLHSARLRICLDFRLILSKILIYIYILIVYASMDSMLARDIMAPRKNVYKAPLKI
jgi:hypothetical protein